MIRHFKKLLVVDDHEADLRVLARSFAAAAPEIEVETLKGSEQAVKHIVSGENDMVLLDINMPGLTGFEVLERARQAEPGALPVVIMLSTSENPSDVRAAYARGAAAYVVKPDSLEGFERLACSIADFWGTLVSRPA